MLRYRTHGTLAAGLGFLAVGCLSEPEIKTNLRPEGPPEVLAVLAVDGLFGETASFCKYVGTALDDKAPGIVQGSEVCPDTADEFEAATLLPLGWEIRLVFDELLNGDAVEELICDADEDGVEDNPITTCIGTIANTRPVTLTCGGTAVAYDGYYYPNGNKESFPVGPAIYVSPDPAELTFATGTTCTVAVGDIVVDKDGNGVASGANSSTFDLKIADLAVLGSDPEPEAAIAPDGAVAIFFNANLDDASVTAADVEFLDSAGAVFAAVAVGVDAYNGDSDAIVFASTDATNGFPVGTYTARLKSGAAFTEVNGGTLTLSANYDVEFTVE